MNGMETEKLSCVVDDRGLAKIRGVDALYEYPGVKVVCISTASKHPVVSRIWSSEYGERFYVAATEEEAHGSVFELTSVTFGEMNEGWATHFDVDKYDVNVVFVHVGYGMTTRALFP